MCARQRLATEFHVARARHDSEALEDGRVEIGLDTNRFSLGLLCLKQTDGGLRSEWYELV